MIQLQNEIIKVKQDWIKLALSNGDTAWFRPEDVSGVTLKNDNTIKIRLKDGTKYEGGSPDGNMTNRVYSLNLISTIMAKPFDYKNPSRKKLAWRMGNDSRVRSALKTGATLPRQHLEDWDE